MLDATALPEGESTVTLELLDKDDALLARTAFRQGVSISRMSSGISANSTA